MSAPTQRWRRAAPGRRGVALVGWGLLFALCCGGARLAGPVSAAQTTSGEPILRLAFEASPPDWTEAFICERFGPAPTAIPGFEPPLELPGVLPQ